MKRIFRRCAPLWSRQSWCCSAIRFIPSLAPYQLHRLIELIKAGGVDLTGKFATQITTSKHFYDVTAHRYVEENCCDLGMKVIRGLAADMEDLLCEQGQKDARNFFYQLMFSCQHGPFVLPPVKAPARRKTVYQPVLPAAEKDRKKMWSS